MLPSGSAGNMAAVDQPGWTTRTDGLVVIGAGPAGLTTAHELVKAGRRPLVIEQGATVGGIARTEVYKGYRFDIGGHRFYTKVANIDQLWREMLGKDLRKVSRLSRIYYRGRFFKYPLQIFDALSRLGLIETVLILFSYLRAQLQPIRPEKTFEHWVTNRFGWRLYQTFFKGYTEKVWGIPCTEIQAEWAAQRIKGLSLMSAVVEAVTRRSQSKSLIRNFDYPVLGPGMMWQRFQEVIMQHGADVRLNAKVVRLRTDDRRITRVAIQTVAGMEELPAEAVISSMPLPELVLRLDPPPPVEVLQAARSLSFRALIVVGVVINRAELFPDNWIYIHSPDVKVGRIQNPKNWSGDLVPDPETTSLALEYFCSETDALWSMSDTELIRLAARELTTIGLAQESDILDGVVFRQPKAYPVYDSQYRESVAIIRGYLDTFANLQTVGRNGLHRYNNQDHSMVTGLLAAKNLEGGHHDIWSVNTDSAYYESA